MDEQKNIAEKDFAQRLNLHRATVAQLRRELVQDEDWHAEPNGLIVLHPAGVEKIMAKLQAGNGDSTAAILAADDKPPEPETLFVARLVSNPRVLLATHDKARKEKPVVVRVKNNALYAVGMQISATPSRMGPVYNVFGRPPRRRSQKIAGGAR